MTYGWNLFLGRALVSFWQKYVRLEMNREWSQSLLREMLISTQSKAVAFWLFSICSTTDDRHSNYQCVIWWTPQKMNQCIWPVWQPHCVVDTFIWHRFCFYSNKKGATLITAFKYTIYFLPRLFPLFQWIYIEIECKMNFRADWKRIQVSNQSILLCASFNRCQDHEWNYFLWINIFLVASLVLKQKDWLLIDFSIGNHPKKCMSSNII